jgi:hypothetical protein
MAYVEFRAPGKNKIFAFVSTLGKRYVRSRFLTKDGGEYVTNILSYEGDSFNEYIVNNEYLENNTDEIEVEVPKGCFAKEPSAWEKSWVNHFFRSRSVDQCDFRRRRLFAYTVQPLIMLFNLLIRSLPLLVATLIGSRNWSLKYLLHPLTYPLSESIGVLFGGSIFIKRVREDVDGGPISLSYIARKLCLLPFMPLVILIVGLLIFVKAFLFVMICLALALLMMVMIHFVIEGHAGKLLINTFRKLDAWLDSRHKSDNHLWYMDRKEMDLLTCNNNPRPLSLRDLPSHKRSISLRFHDLKSKVCRPFSS